MYAPAAVLNHPVMFNISVAPQINLGDMKDIKVKAGQPFSLDIPIKGEPTPTVKWTRDGKEVMPSDRVNLESTPTRAGLNNKCAERGDTGDYTLTLQNENGITHATCKVTVVGRFLCIPW